jgi:hypothetical protein
MALYRNPTTLLVKSETTYGVDSAPTGAANAILATDVSVMPMEGTDIDRQLDMQWEGNFGTIAAGLFAKISFKVEVKGSGTVGTPPVVGPLLKACGMAEVIAAGVSVTYSRISTGYGSATIHLHRGGVRYTMLGCRGNVVQRMTAQGVVYDEFEMWGLFIQPTGAGQPTVNFLTQLTAMPLVASMGNTPVFTIGGVTHALRTFSLDYGNKVEPRLLVNSEEMIITEIRERVEMVIEAVALATLNPYALAQSGTTVPVVLTHGVVAGRIVTHNIPRLQLQRPGQPGQTQNILEWSLRGSPLTQLGNDQLTRVHT